MDRRLREAGHWLPFGGPLLISHWKELLLLLMKAQRLRNPGLHLDLLPFLHSCCAASFPDDDVSIVFSDSFLKKEHVLSHRGIFTTQGEREWNLTAK